MGSVACPYVQHPPILALQKQLAFRGLIVVNRLDYKNMCLQLYIMLIHACEAPGKLVLHVVQIADIAF